jgi:hypothetical protein
MRTVAARHERCCPARKASDIRPEGFYGLAQNSSCREIDRTAEEAVS